MSVAGSIPIAVRCTDSQKTYRMDGPPLHIAAANGRKEVVQILLEKSANIDLKNKVNFFNNLFFTNM